MSDALLILRKVMNAGSTDFYCYELVDNTNANFGFPIHPMGFSLFELVQSDNGYGIESPICFYHWCQE
jgi:hypothetical protein